MTEPENLVLEHLRAIRERLERIDNKIDGLTDQGVAVDQHIVALHLDVHAIKQQLVITSGRLDRIERRLELTDVKS